jgi:hypothetical protein
MKRKKMKGTHSMGRKWPIGFSFLQIGDGKTEKGSTPAKGDETDA